MPPQQKIDATNGNRARPHGPKTDPYRFHRRNGHGQMTLATPAAAASRRRNQKYAGTNPVPNPASHQQHAPAPIKLSCSMPMEEDTEDYCARFAS